MPPILLLVTVWLFNVGLVSSFETYVRGVSLPPDVISSNSSILMADGLVIPRCAVKCIESGFEASSCDTADVPCFCSNIPLQSVLSRCTQLLCPSSEQEAFAQVEGTICKGYPVPYRGRSLRLVSIVLIVITTPIVFLRLFSRYFIAKYVGWDDYTIFLATCLLIILTVLDIVDSDNGLGTHIWYIRPSVLQTLLQRAWLCEMFYISSLSVTKISILLFYNRIFVSRWFLIAVRIVMASVVLYGVAFVLALAFQCYPVRAVWDRTLDHTCINTLAIAYACAAISIFQDLLILALPIPELIGLQVSTRKRINVMVMFGVGLFALATSCVRLKYLISFDNSLDTTWDDVSASTWSVIEINVSIICACLPSLRALLTYLFPAIFKSSSNNHRYSYTSNNADCRSGTNRVKTPSRPIMNFITMPEDLLEQSYLEDFELQNNNSAVYHATRPLSSATTNTGQVTKEVDDHDGSSQASTSRELHSRLALVNPHLGSSFKNLYAGKKSTSGFAFG